MCPFEQDLQKKLLSSQVSNTTSFLGIQIDQLIAATPVSNKSLFFPFHPIHTNRQKNFPHLKVNNTIRNIYTHPPKKFSIATLLLSDHLVKSPSRCSPVPINGRIYDGPTIIIMALPNLPVFKTRWKM